MVRAVIIVSFFLLCIQASAGDLRKVIKAYEKGDHAKTEAIIHKALSTEQVHPGVRYYYSMLYALETYPKANLDSARLQIRQALADLETASEAILKEFTAEGLSKPQLIAQLENITIRWYTQAQDEMTISAWQAFIDLFPEAVQLPTAIHSRDSMAFQEAVSQMTVAAWQAFLQAYPSSSFSDRAVFKRDSLQLISATRSNSRSDLERFVKENPASPHIEEALLHLLKIRTISGDPMQYLDFIKAYPRYGTSQVAIQRLFHLDKENGFKWLNAYADYHYRSDSLRASVGQSATRYFPVFQGQFTMMAKGQSPVYLPFEELTDELICEGWNTDVISGLAKGKALILTKSGKQIGSGKLLRDLGSGLLLVDRGTHRAVLHKSGMEVISSVQDAELINGSLLRVKKDKWSLYSLMGLPLTEHRFDAIFTEGNFWLFQRDGLFATATFDQIVKSFPQGLFLEFKYDDYELIHADLLVGFRDDRECLLRSDGSFVVPWGKQQIYPGQSMGYIRDDRGYALYGQQRYAFFPYLEANEGFVLRKIASGDWRLSSNLHQWEVALTDSVRILNTHAALITGKEPKLIFQNQTQYHLPGSEKLTNLSPVAPYIVVSGNVQTVLGGDGQKLFAGNYESIRLEGDSLFVVNFKGKYGLMNSRGKELLPLQFDYIDFQDGIAAVLKKGKIGGYDLRHRVNMEAIYESKPERIGAYFKLTKGGMKGLIDAAQNIILPFEYDEFFLWTDKEIWTKKDDQYALLDIETKEVLQEATALEQLLPDGTLWKVYGTSGFGVLSNTRGTIIPAGFTDIRLMGEDEHAIILAEQALPEAGFHVITYYTLSGEKIYSHAYRKEDYDKVFCDE